MKWDEITQEQKNAFIHEKVLGKPLHTPCTAGQIDEYMGDYWGCTCGWVSSFHVGESGSTEHELPLPAYVHDWNAAWQLLQHMVKEHCVVREDDNYDEVWHRFTYELNQTHPLEPNIYPWICAWTPEILARSAYSAVTGGQDE